uniref:Plp n=1 Tax=Ganoderma boninense TaxID=34458 RepID=A0A5K1K3P3_9APHY|nr:Plp [Ganoderma boninense]
MASPPQIPPQPQIPGEAMLEIFVHRSIRFPGAPLNTQSPYGDADRLAFIGSRALETAYAAVLFNQSPQLSAADFHTELAKLGEHVERWVAGYHWKDKVRRAQDVNLDTVEESRNIMNAYVGAVFVARGFTTVSSWIVQLVDYSAALQRNG